MSVIQLEFYKLRRKQLLLFVTLFLLIEISWAFMVMNHSIARNPDQASWEPLIMTISTMNGLFLPILSAICVSRICDMEHKGSTWKLLLALSVQRRQLYFAKYFCANSIMLAISLFQISSIAIYGLLKDFTQPIPLSILGQFFIGVILTNAAIIALQQWASLAIKNQAFALALGMIGSFFGMTAGLFPFSIRKFFIWAYFIDLSPIQQHFTNEQITYSVKDFNDLLPLMVTVFMVAVFLYLAGSFHIAKKEV